MRELLDKIDGYQAAINKRRPFEGEMLSQLRDFYRIGLTWSSNAVEGNSLTISETKILLEDGLTVGGRPLRDTFETLGHAQAYDYMFSLLGNKTISEEDILKLHRLFYHNIDPDRAGRYRDIDVVITGSAYALTKPAKIAQEMAKFARWLSESRDKYHPVEFAALAHKKFVFIHPFVDGNGRVARLLMNAALIQAGFLPVIIAPVIRSDYVWRLEEARKDDKPFIKFIAEREEQSQRELMRMFHIPFTSAEQENENDNESDEYDGEEMFDDEDGDDEWER